MNNYIVKTLIIILIYFIPFFGYGQERQNLKGFGFDIGVGYNTYIESGYLNLPEGSYSISRLGDTVMIPSFSYTSTSDAFSFSPLIRVHYLIPIKKTKNNKKKYEIPVFLGYYSFGGAQSDYPSFQDSPKIRKTLSFHSAEFGINPSVLLDNCYIGALIKAQYIFSVKDKVTSKDYEPFIHDVSEDYKNFAMNIGLNIKYRICKFSVGVETWFGLTNLYTETNYGPFKNWVRSIHENNYRLIIGYEF